MISNTNRIAKNTLILYFRMIITMLVSLYTSRIVLSVLGVSDFGVYNVVGGIVAMFSFFTQSIVSGFQRFYCYELGRGDFGKLKQIVSTATIIQLAISVIIVIIAETIGLWFLNNKLVVPPERMYAARVIFHLSILTLVFKLLQSVYNAIIISHEKMHVFAYFSMFETGAKLLVVFVLFLNVGDKLIMYSVLLMLISFLSFAIYFLYCRYNFKDNFSSFSYSKIVFKEMFSFSGWTLFGTFANVLKHHGTNVLLNVFFGTIVNAARGITYQVYTAASSLVQSFQTAFAPQITKSYAQKDFDYLLKLVYSVSKFSFYLMLVLAAPVLMQTEYMLGLWLGDNVPEYSIIFTKIVLVIGLVETLSSPIVNIIYASGRIKKFQLFIGILSLLILPISYLFLKYNYNPEIVFVIVLMFTLLSQYVRLFFVKRIISFSIRIYLKAVVIPIMLVMIAFLIFPLAFVELQLFTGFKLFLIETMLIELSLLTSIYIFGLNNKERKVIQDKTSVFFNNILKIN